ncbi:alpha-1/alpha-2 family phenol-soluble modulin, partial [Staphylococcus aureus]
MGIIAGIIKFIKGLIEKDL